MSPNCSDRVFKEICKYLAIPRNHPVESQINQFLQYSNHDRLKLVALQLEKERKRIRTNKGKSRLTEREKALLNPDRIWGMLKSSYNESLRDYAFLYLAFNVLEDSLRCAVDNHYTKFFNTDEWYQNREHYSNFLLDKYHGKEDKLEWLENQKYSQFFVEKLSFTEVISFLYDQRAWNTYKTKTIFENKNDRETNQELDNLDRCDVFEKLTILKNRRNSVYHHNLIWKHYNAPQCEACIPSVTEYHDGTFSNTRERIYEILRYLGLKPKLVMERIIGNYNNLPLITISS